MIIDYVMIISAVILLGGQFGFQRFYQLKCGTAFRDNLLFNTLLGGFAAMAIFLYSLVFMGSAPQFTVYSFICAMLMALCTTTYTLLGFWMMKNTGMTLFTIFLMMGGMTLPYIYGVANLGERCTAFNLSGLLLILCGILLANIKGARSNLKGILVGSLVFVINGMCSIISKTHQIEAVHATVSSTEFTFWTSLCKVLLCIVVIPFIKPAVTGEKAPGFTKKALICLGAALMFMPASIMQFAAAVNLPATVLYPIVSGGLIIVSAVVDRLVFREKISRTALWGVLLCFIGTCLFL